MYAAAAKSLQSCPTLCDPIDDSPPGSPVLGILQARVLQWGAIAFSMTIQYNMIICREVSANIRWITEKAREFQKNICFCFIDYAKAFDCVDTINCGKFFKRWNTRPPDLPLEKLICRSGSNS